MPVERVRVLNLHVIGLLGGSTADCAPQSDTHCDRESRHKAVAHSEDDGETSTSEVSPTAMPTTTAPKNAHHRPSARPTTRPAASGPGTTMLSISALAVR